MARPLKNESARLTRRLPHIRCTEDEYAAVQRRAEQAGVNLSVYVRDMALNGAVNVTQERRLDFKTADQLRRIGVNLNQQTKVFNATGVMLSLIHISEPTRPY